MAFVRFTAKGRSFIPKVSIRSNGQIGLNNGAIEKYSIAHFRFAILFYDEESNKIGIKLTNEETDKGLNKIRIKDKTATIAAKSFLDFFSIPYAHKTRRFDVEYNEPESMLIINLSDILL